MNGANPAKVKKPPAVESKTLLVVESERRVLAKIAAGVPLGEVFSELMRAIETRSDVEMLASILLLDKDGKRLLHGAAPSLPRSYNSAIHGMEIGAGAGSCGTAAFRGEPVFVTDIASDPLWTEYRDLALQHALRACWSTPIKAANGKVLGTFAIYYRKPRSPTHQDLESISLITHTAALAIERHNAEQALRESQERLSYALNAAGVVGTWDWRVSSNILYCDARLAVLLSLDPRKFERGAAISEFPAAIHADDIGRVRAAVERSIATGEKYSQECRLIQKDGSVRWVVARGECHYNRKGRPLRFAGAVVDITERKLAEAALTESEARLEEALTAGQVVAFEWDPRTGRSQHSKNTRQVLGYEPASSTRRSDFLARVHPDDRARFRAHVYGVCPGRPYYSASFRFVRPDGEEMWLEETARAEFDEAGCFVRLKGLTRNVTARRRAEQHQRQLMAELDHRVKNALACVSVVAQHTRAGSSSIDEFLEVLDGRIQSIANTHALLSRGRWQGVSLTDLVYGELAPCMGDGNAVVEGPHVVLAVEATQAVAMVLHELVTNAAKYGALSTPHGRVSVRWRWRRAADSRWQLAVHWQESGGPAVAAPTAAGYGTTVIRDLIPYELGGNVDLVLASQGVRCRMEIPFAWISDGERPGAAIRSPIPFPADRSRLLPVRPGNGNAPTA